MLTYLELCELVSAGVITPINPEQINGASIDVRLGPTLWLEDDREATQGSVVHLAQKETFRGRPFDLSQAPYDLEPGEFVLAQTLEVFHLPNDITAHFFLKSSSARAGLDAALALFCDPGWHGSVLTLELRNNLRFHTLQLTAGLKVGQVVFHRGTPVPDHASYAVRGQYNQNPTTTPSKGLR